MQLVHSKGGLSTLMLNLHILAIETGNEAHAIRAAAEYWGCTVAITWAGHPDQVIEFFNSPPANIIILSAHGDDNGMYLPDLGEQIPTIYPYRNQLKPDDFRKFIHLHDHEVLNLSCKGGTPELAQAFFDGGASYYIGATDYPEGNATLMYSLEYLYNRSSGLNPQQAHLLAIKHDDDRNQFYLYNKK